MSKSALLGPGRSAPISSARAAVAYRMASEIGLSPTRIAEELSMSVTDVLKAIARGKLAVKTHGREDS